MPVLATKRGEWFVTTDDGKHEIVGPMLKRDAARFVLLLNVIRDGSSAVDAVLYSATDTEWRNANLYAEQWGETVDRLLLKLDGEEVGKDGYQKDTEIAYTEIADRMPWTDDEDIDAAIAETVMEAVG